MPSRKKPKTEDSRLYDMEDRFMRAAMGGQMTRAALQELADKACRRWRVPPVRVRFSTSTKWAGMYYSHNCSIVLYAGSHKVRTGRNTHTLLHEIAHHIDDWKVDECGSSHGPTFAAICLDLYDHYRVLPAAAYRLLAKQHGVKLASGIHHKMRPHLGARGAKKKGA